MNSKNKKEDELIELTNKAIAELVYNKTDLIKAYNYYNCIRDKDLFKYLEDNYGIGNPTSIEFTPLIKKHIDALLGEYLGVPILPRVTCKDSKTLTNIFRDKQLTILKNISASLKLKLRNHLLDFTNAKNDNDLTIQNELDSIVEDINNNYLSEYEIAGLNILNYLMLSRSIDILTKFRMLMLDLLITGYAFYRVTPSRNNTNINIEVLNPLNTFVDYNPESNYIKDAYRVVVRKYMTKSLILYKYSKELAKEDIKLLEENWEEYAREGGKYFVRKFVNQNGMPTTEGIRAGEEVVLGPEFIHPNQVNLLALVPVYEVEWLETDKKSYMRYRVQTVRIGENIYILRGRDSKSTRTLDDFDNTTLSVNGVLFTNRSSLPYSLVLACAHLQDRYDLLHFYRDNLIANSGTAGDWIDVSLIPSFLGTDLAERLKKWAAYKKSTGMALLNTALDGTGVSPLNTIFNGYDDTVKVQAIQSILVALDSIEQTCSSITGVFRERLNGIELHDAVTNVRVSVNNSFTITKHIYLLMDIMTNELLVDALNCAKIVYKNGLTGRILLGDLQTAVFTALPEYYTFTDFDVHINTNSDTVKDIETIKSIIPEFILAGTLKPDVIFDVLTSKSLTDVKKTVNKAMLELEKKNNVLMQLQQLNQLLQLQLQQASEQIKQLSSKVESLNETKLKIEADRLNKESQIDWYKAKTERQYRENTIDIDKSKVNIEYKLLRDGNPYNDKIRYL